MTRKHVCVFLCTLLACLVLCHIDLYPRKNPEPGTKERAVVLSVDDKGLMDIGVQKMGTQVLEVEIRSGKWKGSMFRATNQLRADMELDKIFEVGDVILVGILNDADPLTSTVNAQDHYRVTNVILLFGLFSLLLLLFGGWTGFNALFSFLFTGLVLWKVVIPLCLRGWNPILVCFAAVVILCLVIIFLVAGPTRKGVTAFCGALLGVLASSALAYVFVYLFKINGAMMPRGVTLLNSGFESLSLPAIFIGAIFLSASGAVMDLAMDVAAGMEEVVQKKPDIARRELLSSGLRIGRAVVGTMTTTLLLAYSGGYMTMLMVFTATGTSMIDLLNHPYLVPETAKTLVGSFGLVLVAPFTAFVGAFVFVRRHNDSEANEETS